MSNMIQLANIPREVLPSPNTTYNSADDWYTALANMQQAQLVFQHNDLVVSEDDCRNKYISRHLFRKLAKEGKLSIFGFAEDNWSAQAKKMRAAGARCLAAPDAKGSFRLWCDDLRPDNFLVDEHHEIIAAIDWEFTYAAPTQFALDPPWWLLLEKPEMWSTGLESWAAHCERRLQTWISGMKAAESRTHPNALPFNLSEYMLDSWEKGRFWLNYAARKSWAFDAMYCKYLDERFFGERKQASASEPFWKTRVDLLNRQEQLAMDAFVTMKMNDVQVRKLDSWAPGEARRHMAKVLGGDGEMHPSTV
ncbi:hypothetical protein V2A60_001348 [Cordyceps javanica]